MKYLQFQTDQKKSATFAENRNGANKFESAFIDGDARSPFSHTLIFSSQINLVAPPHNSWISKSYVLIRNRILRCIFAFSPQGRYGAATVLGRPHRSIPFPARPFPGLYFALNDQGPPLRCSRHRVWNCSWLYLAVILRVTFHLPMVWGCLKLFSEGFFNVAVSWTMAADTWLVNFGSWPRCWVPPLCLDTLTLHKRTPDIRVPPLCLTESAGHPAVARLWAPHFFRKILVFDSDPIRVVFFLRWAHRKTVHTLTVTLILRSTYLLLDNF